MRYPRLVGAAIWILERFGSNDEGLSGDLIQEFGKGRSIAWLFKQVFVAICIGVFDQAWNKKGDTFRALLEGIGLATLLFQLTNLLLMLLPLSPVMSVPRTLVVGSMVLIVYGTIGAILRRMHPPSALLLFLLFSVVWPISSNLLWLARLLTESTGSRGVRLVLASFILNVLMGTLGLILGSLMSFRKSDFSNDAPEKT